MRFVEISAQLGSAQARPVVVLDPGQPARGKVGRGPEAGLVLQDLEGERADLEGNGGFAAIPLAADGEDLAADLPDVGPAPLDHVGGGDRKSTRLNSSH